MYDSVFWQNVQSVKNIENKINKAKKIQNKTTRKSQHV